jgi:hypothetical protein
MSLTREMNISFGQTFVVRPLGKRKNKERETAMQAFSRPSSKIVPE